MSESKSHRRVFVSYSHTSDEHKEWVLNFATDLRALGIDVVLDVWDLKEGDDMTKFMESMVHDESIDRVLLICDTVYVRKANDREGGVGTESQIITGQIYNQVKDSKFIPILRDTDEYGGPCLPHYLKTRLGVSFIDDSEFQKNLEHVARVIFDKPQAIKPPLGRIPKWLAEDPGEATTQLSSASTARQFRQCLILGRGNQATIWNLLVEDVDRDLNTFVVDAQPLSDMDVPQSLLKTIDELRELRDVIVDSVILCARDVFGDWVSNGLCRLLATLTIRIGKTNVNERRIKDDDKRFLASEVFIYLMASLIEHKRLDLIPPILNASYPVDQTYLRDGFDGISVFSDEGRFLKDSCPESRKWISYSGELMKQRATRSDVKLNSIAQADALIWLRSFTKSFRWIPSVALYVDGYSILPEIRRAMRTKSFETLNTIVEINDIESLSSLVMGDVLERLSSSRYFHTGLDDAAIFGAHEFRRHR